MRWAWILCGISVGCAVVVVVVVVVGDWCCSRLVRDRVVLRSFGLGMAVCNGAFVACGDGV